MQRLQIILLLIFISSILFAQENEWTSINNGFENLQVYTIVDHPEDPDILYAGAEDGLYRSNNRGAQWQNLCGGLPVRAIWVSPDGRTILIARSGGSRSDGIWISRNGGDFDVLTWILWPTAIAVDPENLQFIFCGSIAQGFIYSLNGGEDWQEEGLRDNRINHISIKNSEDETYLFASTASGLYRSDYEDDLAWDFVGPHRLPACQTAFTFEDDGGVFVGTGDVSDSDGLYYSDDLGDNWDVSIWAWEVQAVETMPELVVMASTEVGVMRSSDGGENWREMNEELDDFDISDLMVQVDDDETRFYCSTNGSGIFVYILPRDGDRPPTPFNLLEPADGDTLENMLVHFLWETSEDPDPDDEVGYEMWLSVGGDSLMPEFADTALVVEEDTVRLQVDLSEQEIDFPRGEEITWWVIAVSGDLTTECEERFTFIIRPEDLPPSPFSLLEPENGVTVRTLIVTFTWEASEDPDPEDEVTYNWEITYDECVETIEDLDTTVLILNLDSMEVGGEAFWVVTAVSGDQSTRCDMPFTFFYEPTSVNEDNNASVTGFHLYPAHPNPFNATTTIRYSLPFPGLVSMQVFNQSGQRISTLFEGQREAGFYSVNLRAGELASGLYFVRLNHTPHIKGGVRENSQIRKAMLIK